MSDTFPAPFECPLAQVEPPWVDYNGHLNMAYYNVVFDQALDHAYDRLGIGEDYVGKSGCSHFTVEAHVCYQELARPSRVKSSPGPIARILNEGTPPALRKPR